MESRVRDEQDLLDLSKVTRVMAAVRGYFGASMTRVAANVNR
jgi:hypothetical protein